MDGTPALRPTTTSTASPGTAARPRRLGRLPAAREGQSLVELACTLPIFLLILLGAINVGLAIRAQLQLSQVAQQAAQILVHHPDYGDNLVVTLTGATGGTFTLTTSGGTGGTTTGIAPSATAATVQAALEALPDVGAGNVTVTSTGAGGPFTVIFGGTATATGLTADGSSLTSNSGGANATTTPAMTLVAYINSLSSYQLTPSQVSLTVGTSTEPSGLPCTLANKCVEQDTVTINYPFPLIFPMAGMVSVGRLRSGAINLGTTASTIAATHPVLASPPNPPAAAPHLDCVSTASTSCQEAGVTVTTGPNQHVITWMRPVEAEPKGSANGAISLPIPTYCLTVYYTDGGGSFLPHNVGCVPATPIAGNSRKLYYVDKTDYAPLVQDPTQLGVGGNIYYAVAAQQVNGVQSAASTKVNQ